jgi:hypothetical protein
MEKAENTGGKAFAGADSAEHENQATIIAKQLRVAWLGPAARANQL